MECVWFLVLISLIFDKEVISVVHPRICTSLGCLSPLSRSLAQSRGGSGKFFVEAEDGLQLEVLYRLPGSKLNRIKPSSSNDSAITPDKKKSEFNAKKYYTCGPLK